MEAAFYSLEFYLDSSKQRNRLRSKITSDKAKLSLRVEEYNKEREHQQHPNMPVSCALSEVMQGNFPWGNNAGKDFVKLKSHCHTGTFTG